MHIAIVCVYERERERSVSGDRANEYYAANIDGLC